jgi:hypothetical protein
MRWTGDRFWYLWYEVNVLPKNSLYQSVLVVPDFHGRTPKTKIWGSELFFFDFLELMDTIEKLKLKVDELDRSILQDKVFWTKFPPNSFRRNAEPSLYVKNKPESQSESSKLPMSFQDHLRVKKGHHGTKYISNQCKFSTKDLPNKITNILPLLGQI